MYDEFEPVSVFLLCHFKIHMPGYKVTPVEPLKSGLVCRECQLVLREAVQTEDGDRLCRSCYDDIKRTGVSKNGIALGEGEVGGL